MSPTCFYLLAERDLYRCSAQGFRVSAVARQYWWSGTLNSGARLRGFKS